MFIMYGIWCMPGSRRSSRTNSSGFLLLSTRCIRRIHNTSYKKNLIDNLVDKESIEVDEKYDFRTMKQTFAVIQGKVLGKTVSENSEVEGKMVDKTSRETGSSNSFANPAPTGSKTPPHGRLTEGKVRGKLVKPKD